MQDEAGGLLEGDRWGLRDRRARGDRASLTTLVAGVEWYRRAADDLLAGIDHVDRATCVLVGWDGARRVSAETLRGELGMTGEIDLMDFF